MSAIAGHIKDDKDYLQYYWDLASEDAAIRLKACDDLVKYLRDDISQNNNANLRKEYQEYTLKRLVKGLTSPRDCARQGFATSLCEVLRIFPYSVQDVLSLLDENTQMTGSVKGSEERDKMFGKLFGYVAIIRSDILFNAQNSKKANEILTALVDGIVDLHQKKLWIQETTIETLLLLLSGAIGNAYAKKNNSLDESSIDNMVGKLFTLINTEAFSENNENQLSLLLGLQQMGSQHAKLQKVVSEHGKKHNIPTISAEHMEEFVTVLFHSTNKFPKFHRVWEYFMGFIIPMNADRELGTRPSSLTEAQQTALTTFIDFLDEHMWRSSKEKRAVALKLTVKLASLVPSEYIPVVLSENMIRSVLLSRLKTKNLLYDFAGGILKELIGQVEGDSERTLSLLTALSQHGGMNFDKRTSTNTVQALIEKMDTNAIHQYVKLLCELIGSFDSASEKSTDAASDKKTEDDEEVDEEEKASPAISAVHSLITLARLNHIANKDNVQLAVLSILSRLGCFTEGETKAVSTATEKKKKTKTPSKKGGEDNVSKSDVDLFSVECVKILEKGSLKESIPAEIANVAALQLIALASELALKTSSSHASSSEEANNTAANASSSSNNDQQAIYRLWSLINHMVTSNLVPRFQNTSEEDDEDDEHEMTQFDLPQFIIGIHAQIEYFSGLIRDAKTDENLKRFVRFAESSSTLLIIGTVHVLTSNDIQKITIMQAAIILKELCEKAKEDSFGDEVDEEFEDEEDSLELRLFEACSELLSLSNDQAIKGLRESIKRVWNCLFPLIGEENLSQSFMDALVGQVTDPEDYDKSEQEGNDQHNHEEDDGEEEDDDDGGSDQEEEDEEEEEEEEPSNKKGNGNKKKELQAKISAKRKEAEAAGDDLMVQEDDMIDFLMVDDEELNAELGLNNDDDSDSDDDDDGAVVHSAEADAALVKLIQMKKENRKQGLLAAKRKQILLRSRLLDILEIMINRARSGTIIFSLFVPMVLGVKKVLTSKLIQEIAEGRPFAQRLQNLLTNQLCKKKFSLKISDNEDMVNDCNEELDIFIEITSKLLSSKIQPLRATSQEAILAMSRAIINSDSVSSQEKIAQFFQSITKKFITMRRSQIPSKWLEEVIVNRFPQFFLPSLWKELIEGIASSTTNAFVRNELVEMVVTIVKKFHSLDASTQDSLFAQFPQLVNALGVLIDESVSNNATEVKDKNNKKKDGQSQVAKKLRSAVTAMKTLFDCVVKSKRDCKTLDKSLHKARKSLESAKEFASKTQGVSPAISQLSEQSLVQIATLVGNTTDVPDNGEKKKKKDKQKVEEKVAEEKKDKKRQSVEPAEVENKNKSKKAKK